MDEADCDLYMFGRLSMVPQMLWTETVPVGGFVQCQDLRINEVPEGM